MLPSYGGSLFDPDRYPFLEGRPLGSRWHSKPAEPLEINNRVVLHLLKSLQMLQVRVPGGGPAEARRISFRALDIESIGRIYEGLLDHTAIRTKEVVLGLAASRKKPVASMALSEIEKLMQDKPKLVEALEEETGKQAKSLEKALNSGAPNEFHKVLVACRQDQKLAERIIQFGGLLRQDSFERPVIVLPGGIYVGQGSARRSTGTHYTPSSLTEPIVQHTLEPLVYQGPVDGMPKEQWQLKSPKEILDLKVCDMAMGSGAFLVQACRYLSERLVESWENLENAHPGEVLITPEGQFSQGEPSERLIPKDAAERLAIARRLVADRCIYGVDINPMAVEMAKLSIWLITVDKTRPFTFLDHALKCGDSLLGISSLQQIENFSLRAGEHQITFSTANLFRYVEEASAKRKALEAIPSDRFDQIEAKNMLYQEAESATAKLKAVASCVVSFELRALDGQDYDDQRTIAADATEFEMHKALADFQAYVRKQLREYVPLHWALEFPEVFDAGGFDAVIGNPPFLGGKRISTVHGDHYEQYLKSVFARSKGAADLCCYFFRKAFSLLKKRGAFGLLATKSIAEGDSRDVGIQALLDSGATMYRARKAFPWPGTAGVVAALVHAAKGPFGQPYILNEQEVFSISSFLDAGSHSQPYKLGGSGVLFSQGTTVNGDGFILDLEEANELLRKDNRNRDVIRPYLNGEMFNNSADFQPSRFVIDFETRSEQEARSYADPFVIVEERVRAHRDTLTRQVHESRFWLFWDKREAFYKAIRPKARVLVCAIVTKHLAFQFTNTDWVFSHQLKIFDTQSYGVFGLLQSSLHEVWARKFISRLGGTLRYSTSDAFETFPFPTTSVAEGVAREYHECRSKVMLARNEGLTKVYNRFHHPNDQSEDVVQLRLLHVKLDESVITAYGWNDLRLNHRFQDVGDGLRYTVDEAARNAVMERLMELNHRSHEMKAIARVGKKLTARSKLSAGNKRTEKRTGQNPLF
ncbi:MAG TPA: DNA methyltransferase [Candidatus Angelobacter sp.]|nr:DNA methyltransferase [Candidatus Angelobacter sp.]